MGGHLVVESLDPRVVFRDKRRCLWIDRDQFRGQWIVQRSWSRLHAPAELEGIDETGWVAARLEATRAAAAMAALALIWLPQAPCTP